MTKESIATLDALWLSAGQLARILSVLAREVTISGRETYAPSSMDVQDPIKLRALNGVGRLEFEDVFIPYDRQSPVPQSELVFDARRTGTLWTGSYQKGIHVPVIYLANRKILLPEKAYRETNGEVLTVCGSIGLNQATLG